MKVGKLVIERYESDLRKAIALAEADYDPCAGLKGLVYDRASDRDKEI